MPNYPLVAAGGGGLDYIDASEPGSPKKGETWFDPQDITESPWGTVRIYADYGSGLEWHILPLASQLTEGRTRELLLLLQDSPVPEVQDPLNIQGGLSDGYETVGNDYAITDSILGDSVSRAGDNNQQDTTGARGLAISPNVDLLGLTSNYGSNMGNVGDNTADLRDSENNVLDTTSITNFNVQAELTAGETYYLVGGDDNSVVTVGYNDNPSFPYTGNELDITAGYAGSGETSSAVYIFQNVRGYIPNNTAKVTDQFDAPTTAPADFKAWESIKAKDVTVGGSTVANPVQFEILDSSDSVLNSSKIPRTLMDDTEFKLRDRTATLTAGSDDDSSYTIPTTGAGGHFEIDVLTVVSVKHEGTVIDPSNWSFDGTDTVTVDTSAYTSISNGDDVTVKYDLDVFDSTLQPRAYLERASSGETSPSISHFEYRYVV